MVRDEATSTPYWVRDGTLCSALSLTLCFSIRKVHNRGGKGGIEKELNKEMGGEGQESEAENMRETKERGEK